MRSDLLLELAGRLDGLWPDVFDMTVWAEIRADCGTAACALGHAAAIFAHLGLRLKWDYPADALRPGDSAIVLYGPAGVYPASGYAAGAWFFEIEPWDAIHLFCPHAYRDDGPDGGEPRMEPHDITPYEVADRIRAFVANREAVEVYRA